MTLSRSPYNSQQLPTPTPTHTAHARTSGTPQVFGVTPDGAFQFNDYIFPHAGTWTVQQYDVTDGINETAAADAATIVVA